MLRNDTRLMESAVALAEELHYSRAARKVRISQPMLTKNIQDLESLVGGPLFIRDRKHVTLSDAGKAYVQHARLSLMYGERAFQAARSALTDRDIPLYVGRSPYVDPFLVSTLLSIELPLFPKLRIDLLSQYSSDLVHDLLAGTVDLAIANNPPESALLSSFQVAETPFYIGMSRRDELASFPAMAFEKLANRKWILFERRLHPVLYDRVMRAAEQRNVYPRSIQHITSPEEAFPFIVDQSAIAFLVKAGTLLVARNGVTVRPLVEPDLVLKTCLISRADNESRIVGEMVRTYMRRLSTIGKQTQMRLPISN